MRARRNASGETIASVAIRAGLSVPYIANLENGRGNPTLATLTALARALGADLRVELVEPGHAASPAPTARPVSLTKFAQLPRFAAEANRLAALAGCPVTLQRENLLDAMSSVAAATPGSPGELDWHRVLDAIVLMSRG